MSQNKMLIIALVVMSVILGSFVVWDLNKKGKLNGLFGKQETSNNWKWDDDWKSESVPEKAPPKPDKKSEPVEVQVVAQSYTDAIQRSSELGKPVLVLFTTSSCNWCEKLKKETLKDNGVKSMMTKYIFVEVDVTKNRLIAKKFGVTALPTTLITNGKEENLKILGGFKPAKAYEEWLNNPELLEQPRDSKPKQEEPKLNNKRFSRVPPQSQLPENAY